MQEANCGFDHAPNGKELLIRFGPELRIDLGFDPSYDPDSETVPVPNRRGLNALVDTGASESYIDSDLALALSLPSIDTPENEVITPIGRKKELTVYLAQIHVISLKRVQYGSFLGLDMRANGLENDVILGRSFLGEFVFSYDGSTGRATLTPK